MNVKKIAREVLDIEINALSYLKKTIKDNFVIAVNILKRCKGKVVIIGLGKSGIIGQKISATLSSTGTPSIYLHPVEAAHGDIGVIRKKDVVIIISQSGETEEITDLLPSIKDLKIPVIAITGNKNSTLSKNANCVIDSYVKEEACPMGLAPTASSIVQLAIGDALAIALLKIKKFKKEDFAKLHPGGVLGKKLTLKVKDIMHTGDELPVVKENTILKKALLIMTKKRFGCLAVIDEKNKLCGIFTDGDLRRLIEKNANPFSLKMSSIMIKNPKVIKEDELVVDALSMMEKNKITVLLIPDKNKRLKGIIHLHDILSAGIV
ncbi:MAG: KpsF/GutQ family sugar-phosphate isomerase [Candidatus Goldbacteria bacterium]|nr:KpsF/GutQ family sugar-phosphate isomerase [Candidatus Goldiibacteriota bacterium]